MRYFDLKKKTGFEVQNPDMPVEILDESRREFYDTILILPVKYFNMPAGGYFLVKGAIQELPTPFVYNLAPLPLSERFGQGYPNPLDFDVKWGSNPDKCTVFWDNGFILCDFSLQSLPKYIRAWIIFHEAGHQFYTTEDFCDLYSGNCMLRTGFTPYQVDLAKEFSRARIDEHGRKHIASPQDARYYTVKNAFKNLNRHG